MVKSKFNSSEISYLKKYEKFRLFLSFNANETEAQREQNKKLCEKIENGILKNAELSLPQLEENERSNFKATRICDLTLVSTAGICLLGSILEKQTDATPDPFFISTLIGVGAVSLGASIKHRLKRLIMPKRRDEEKELERIGNELKDFGQSDAYLSAFMKLNGLSDQEIEDGRAKILLSPLTHWGKLIEIYPELEKY